MNSSRKACFTLWMFLFVGKSAFSALPKVLLFDVFGTCVQVRSSLIEQGNRWSGESHIKVDWPFVVDAWIYDHVETIQAIRMGEENWMSVDEIHERSLNRLVKLRAQDRKTINLFWHKLKPWPDTSQGLISLKRLFSLAALSNGNETLLKDLAVFAKMPWDNIFSSEKSMHYKPDREAYAYPAAALKLNPEELMLVAAHPYDLEAAKNLGWKTAFVMRKGEYSGYTKESALLQFDYVASDFMDLSHQLADDQL